jgi:hypothetical protein
MSIVKTLLGAQIGIASAVQQMFGAGQLMSILPADVNTTQLILCVKGWVNDRPRGWPVVLGREGVRVYDP